MTKHSMKQLAVWLGVLVGVGAMGEATGWVLRNQGFAGLGGVVRVLGWVGADVWLVGGLWVFRERAGAKWLLGMVVGSHAAAGLSAGLWWWGHELTATAVGGTWVMALLSWCGLMVVRGVLWTSNPVAGVARTLVSEAVSERIAVAFAVCLCVLVPVLAVVPDPKELLNYRLKTFLTWSVSGVSFLLSVMTILLACWTICNEVSGKQIFLTLTKPVSRWQYLLGKWLGIMLVNLMLLLAAGGGVWAFSRLVAGLPARDEMDRVAVEEQVMTARASARPAPAGEMNMKRLYEQYVAMLRRENPERYGTEQRPGELSEQDRQQVRNWAVNYWHTIPRLEGRAYVFTGLERASEYGEVVQLRFKPKAAKVGEDQMVKLAFWLNGRPWPVAGGVQQGVRVANNHFHVMDLSAKWIDSKGNLEVRVANVDLENPLGTLEGSVNFSPGEGLEVLYRVGGFEGNLARGLGAVWVRLGFLAALGLMAGTFLGFPTACLLSAAVYAIALMSEFLADSLLYFTTAPPEGASAWEAMAWMVSALGASVVNGRVWEAVKMLIRLFDGLVVMLMPALGRFDVAPLVADGRMVAYGFLWEAVWRIGLVWMGACGAIGWLAFGRRELAAEG